MSEQMDEARPGYAEIKLASTLHRESGAWAFFMREVMRLPVEMTPAVIQVIRLESWRLADPIEAVRSDAFEAHLRAWAKPASRSPMTAPVSGKARCTSNSRKKTASDNDGISPRRGQMAAANRVESARDVDAFGGVEELLNQL